MTLQENIQKKSERFGQLAPVFLEGANFALENQWINVNDDLPCNYEELITTEGYYKKETINVITLDIYGIIEGNYMVLYDNDKWGWKYGAKPCYWMLIPKLPKECNIEI